MSLSEDLTVAYRALQINFFTEPKEVWIGWADVPEQIGHDMIAILNSMVERGIRGERQIPILTYRAFKELSQIALLKPWNELIELSSDRGNIQFCRTVSQEDLLILSKIKLEINPSIA